MVQIFDMTPTPSSASMIGSALGQGMSKRLGLMEAEQALTNAGNDPIKLAMAMNRASMVNPGLERSLGQIYQQLLGAQRVKGIYGDQTQQQTGQGQNQAEPSPQIPGTVARGQPSAPRSTPWNVKTPEQIVQKARNDAMVTNDPSQFQRSVDEQNTQNTLAINYRNNLESLARREGVSDEDIPDFMEVAENIPTENPDQWIKQARQAYAPIKNAMDSYNKTFIPGWEAAFTGVNRDKALKNLVPTSQRLKSMGREEQARKFLASKWLSPTEIEEQMNPLSKQHEQSLMKLPKGTFPAHKRTTWTQLLKGEKPKHLDNPFVTYEEALEKAPKEMQVMQNRLSDFFLKNVDENTSLSVLRDKLWEDKDYDWRQISSALREAMDKGLQLTERQISELPTIESQAPIQSLPDIMQGWWRWLELPAGRK